MEENTNFASELLAEVKAQSKRNFILFILMVILEGLTIAWFTLPGDVIEEEEETVSGVKVNSEGDGVATYFGDNQIGGDLNNGERYSGEGDKEKEDEEKEEWKEVTNEPTEKDN